MPVYVDELFVWPAKEKQAHRLGEKNGHRWCHMIADTEDELHIMAQAIGLRRAWFQTKGTPHYDLTPGRRKKALWNGAVALSRADFVALIRRKRQESAETSTPNSARLT